VQIRFVVGMARRCTLPAEWLIGDQLAMAIQSLTKSLLHSPLAARRKWGRVEWEREGDPEIQQTTEKDKCRIKNGEGEKAPRFSRSEIYRKARSEARKKKRIERLGIITDIVDESTSSKEP
jgi:hypothetical protein